MLSAELQSHAVVGFRYYQQNLNWSRASVKSEAGGELAGVEKFRVVSQQLEIRLQARVLGQEQGQGQAAVASLADKLAAHGVDLSQLHHQGRPLSELGSDEAKELVSEGGYWGVAKTSQRLAEFVLRGAGDNMEMLRSGREGILRGFKEAEKIWGGKLPEISHQTITRAVEMIDQRIHALGGSVIDQSA